MMPLGMGADVSGEEQKNGILHEFEGFVECPLFSGECKINIEKDGISITSLFQQLPVHYGEISALEWRNYKVALKTAVGEIIISRMGQEAQWLYEKLYAAYNDAVLKALYVSGEVLLETTGEYTAGEEGISHQGEAILRLYEDCLCILPPNDKARRLPLCFFAKAQREDYTYQITLATGEQYGLSRLGYGLDELERMLRDLFYQLRTRTSSWQKELAPELSSLQAATAAGMMTLGRAADYQKLKTAAPPLAAALEEKLEKSHIAGTWPWLCKLNGGEGLMLGAMPAPEKDTATGMESLMGNLDLSAFKEKLMPGEPNRCDSEGEGQEALAEPLPILWLIAPDEKKRLAAVELALADNEAAATYLYRIEGDWLTFAGKIDRALEACAFHREVIFLPEEKLNTPKHLADAMVITRTPVLGTLRRAFAGRAIHTSFERWMRDIEKCRDGLEHTTKGAAPMQAAQGADGAQEPKTKFCTSCGAKLQPEVKFCGQCGTIQQ